MALAGMDIGEGGERARALLGRPDIEAIELARPALDDLPYRDFVHAVLARPGLKLDFRSQEPDAVMAMLAGQMFGPGHYAREAALLAEDIAALKRLAGSLVDGPPPLVSVRTYFAPGDLVWHLDRMGEPASYRLLWAIGRPHGMRVTAAGNVDQDRYRAFMRREHALLCQLDTRVLRARRDLRQAWAHRPEQVAAMMSGDFPFLIDPQADYEIAPGAASIHRVDTPQQQGTFHRSSWGNHLSPGFQIVITVAGDAV